ncbi:hypothetical protein [Haloechinothrix salitolerans]|uniref:Lipoprotein n=1 Tax=Haloechinothrix salitolerans TaxID=926830 RepID=A0ABW2C740_9PSEU
MHPLSRFVIVAALPLALAACVGGKTYDEQVTFKVYEISGAISTDRARLVIQGKAPGEPIKPISHVSADLADVPPDVEVGDILVCRVHQTRENLADTNVELTVDNCRHQ